MDDIDFGSSVWASSSTQTPVEEHSSPVTILPTQSNTKFEDDAFGDDDFQFNEPVQTSTLAAQDDDFGDFGDFGVATEGQASESFAQSSTFIDEPPFTSQDLAEWEALRLHPLPSSSNLKANINDILEPLFGSVDASEFLTNDHIRQVGGLNQILVTSESRSLYQALYQSPPPNTQPPNWTRSRVRRRHLVSLGIPVNLDEVLPHINGKSMPALSISTRPMSAPPGSRVLSRVASPPPASSAGASRPGSRPGSKPPSRAGTPKPSPLSRASTFAQLGLGPPPEVDGQAVDDVLALTPETLSLLPLSTIEAQLARARSLTVQTSSLLAYLLQQRDALQQDSETYNKLVAELIGEAQKAKAGPKTRMGGSRRASGMT